MYDVDIFESRPFRPRISFEKNVCSLTFIGRRFPCLHECTKFFTPEILKNTRYIWLKNSSNLTKNQGATFDSLSQLNLKTLRVYHLKTNSQAFYSLSDREAGEAYLNKWYYWATHSRLEPMIKVAKTIKRHWDGILSWFDSHLTNALLEGLNSLVQAAKSRARGYRSNRNFIAMAYLIGAKLKFDLPT